MAASLHTVEQLRELARRRLPRFVFDFMDGGSGAEVALRNNVAAFQACKLVPRVCVDTSARTTEAILFGTRYALPLGVAPMGLANLVWPGTDLALARMAEKARLPYVISTAGTTTIEAIASVAPTMAWFQLYIGDSESIWRDLLKRAQVAGIRTLVVTVDIPVPGKRVRDLNNRLVLPLRPVANLIWDVVTRPSWALATLRAGSPRNANLERYVQGDSGTLAQKMAAQISAKTDWMTIAAVRALWSGPLVIKGILHPQDAVLAFDNGADGIILSNHGGRQLDSALAPIEILPHVVKAVGGRGPVMLDSGVTCGGDIARALSRGAAFVFAGKPFLYGIGALGPEKGSATTRDILHDEFQRELGLLGCVNPAALCA